MSIRRRYAVLVILTLCCIIFPAPLEAAPDTSHRYHVLLLHSYHNGMRWVDDITTGFTKTLRRTHPQVEFHIEYMDTKRVLNQEHLNNLLDTYRNKFRNIKFALVTTADDTAFRFVLEYDKELFPGVPLVFCGVNNFDQKLLVGRSNATGILEDVDIAGTLQTALTLHPNTKKVYIVNDRSESGKGLHEKIDKAIAPFANRITFNFLEDYSIEELSRLEQTLPSDSIMLRSAFFIDKAGQVLPDEVASLDAIGSHAQVPVYSLWDFFLGLGIVGGKLVSGTAHGETAALMAGQILDGASPSAIPIVTESPNRYMFDYRQMQRFGIKNSLLPPGSVVINGPEPFYSIDKPLLWLGSLFTITLSFTSLLLYRAVRRRKQAEELLRASRDRLLEQQITMAGVIRSDVFSGDDMDKAIRYLVDVGAWQLRIARVSLWLFNPDHSHLRCVDLYDLATDTHCCAFDLQAADYPIYFSALAKEEMIVANDAQKHPSLQEFTKTLILPLGISSRLDVPIHLFKEPIGALCMEHTGPAIEWSAEQRFFVSALANLAVLVIEQHQRRLAEQSLRHADAKFRDLFNSAGDAIIIHDLNGLILEVNQKMCNRLDYSREELLTMTLAQINTPEQANFILQRIEAAKSGDRVLYETEHLKRDGTLIPVEVNSRLTDYEGAPVILSVIRNISGRREMERLKDEMLSAVSHELRTPLTTIIGYTSFMIETIPDGNEQVEYLKTIYDATIKLEELINNFLDLQRLNAKRGPLKNSSLPLPPLLQETVDLYAMGSPRHNLTVDCPSTLPPVLGDGDQLLQVFSNLVSNALKFSPNGGDVCIAVNQEDNYLVVQVKDEGIGIPIEAQEFIFERFYRVDNTDRRKFGGLGLGLSLVKQIIDLHHGSIRVESMPGAGSIFFVNLPIATDSVPIEDIN